METTVIVLTNAYQLLALTGAWSIIQVRDKEGAEFYFGATPAAKEGFILDKDRST